MDCFKRPISFEDWEAFFASNPDIVINAVIRASSYKGKMFVQVVPTSMAEIKLEASFNENETDLEFFEF